MRVDRRVWAYGCAFGLVGCLANVPIGHGDPAVGDEGGTGEDSGSGVKPSGPDASDGGTSVTAAGYVELTPQGPQPSTYELQVSASFWRGGQEGPPAACSTRTVGACVVLTCPDRKSVV